MDRFQALLEAPTPEAAARKLVSAALDNGRGNLGMIRSARVALRPEEWANFQSLIVREMGKPQAGARGVAQEIDFSVNRFLTNWRGMDQTARAAMFNPEHRFSLDMLSRVVSRLSNVEAVANGSRSATNAINVSMLFGGAQRVASGDLISPLAMGSAGIAASYLMSRPAYAAWAVRYANLRAAVLGLPLGTVYGVSSSAISGPAMQSHITALAKMAREDPLLGDALSIVKDENADILRSPSQPPATPSFPSNPAAPAPAFGSRT